MIDGTEIPECSTWEGMIDWLVESFSDQPCGLIIDLGPSGYVLVDEDDDDSRDRGADERVVCAQVHVLADGVFLVRRSERVLGRLRLDSHCVDGLETDRWFFDDYFEDCTDGYLFTRDVTLAADACVSWFRDVPGAPVLEDIGCDYEYPDSLPLPGEQDTASIHSAE